MKRTKAETEAPQYHVEDAAGRAGVMDKGICKSNSLSLLTASGYAFIVIVGVNGQQKWAYEIRTDGKVKLRHKNIVIIISQLQFEEDWEIIGTEAEK